MKIVALTVLFAFLALSITTNAKAAAPGAMSGKSDYGSKGYDQAAKEKTAKPAKMKKQK
jgi:hypothetical protein